MRKRTEQFAAGLRLNSVRSPDARARGVTPLENVLAKRDQSDILRDLRARSVRNFGDR